MDTTTDHFTPLVLCVRGKKNIPQEEWVSSGISDVVIASVIQSEKTRLKKLMMKMMMMIIIITEKPFTSK